MSEHGHDLYLEVDGFDSTRCSHFVREAVLPLLTGPKLPRTDAAVRIRDYLQRFGSRVYLWTDAPNYDGWLLSELIADIRHEMPEIRVCVPEFRGNVARLVYGIAIEKAYRNGLLQRHHALDDAKARRAGWRAAKRVAPRQIREAIEEAAQPKKVGREHPV